MKLVIVESPTKSKTIGKFLGKDYVVLSSYGHIRDLPKKELGVDVKNNFEPTYEIPEKAKKTIRELRKKTKEAKEVILATDEDREGEAIAFHLKIALKLEDPKRIVFHEITKKAIDKALKTPRKINMDLVNAQQARRVLDRLVGYKLSPFLWKKVMRGLSAGRVQSVCVKLICVREAEIKKFKPEEYWSLEALFKKGFLAVLKKEITNRKQSDTVLKDLKEAKYEITKIQKKEEHRNPSPPFITSTLQQTAATKFGFSAKRTMMLAQRLYEKGFITYHRTDSLNLAQDALKEVRQYIVKNFGQEYLKPRVFKTKSSSAQEAHEAIRSTNLEAVVKDGHQAKLYELIKQRFLASQMEQAIFDTLQIDIKAKDYLFKAHGQTLKFDGFLKVYPVKFKENTLPDLKEKEILDLDKLIPEQHFTKPPARYSEASLIKALEKAEIGRPSTYAPTIDTIQQRGYVEKNEQKKFQPTRIGGVVNDLLVKHFPQIVDLEFTAKMEKELDEVAKGKDTWTETLKDFYFPFEENLKKKTKEVERVDLTEKTDKICPECKAPILLRPGRYGKFYACSKFPKCKYSANIKKPSLGIKCPKCKGDIVEKNTKRKKIFYGCSNWPKCDFASWDKLTQDACSKCKFLLTEKGKCSNKECGDYGKKYDKKTKKES